MGYLKICFKVYVNGISITQDKQYFSCNFSSPAVNNLHTVKDCFTCIGWRQICFLQDLMAVELQWQDSHLLKYRVTIISLGKSRAENGSTLSRSLHGSQVCANWDFSGWLKQPIKSGTVLASPGYMVTLLKQDKMKDH